MLFDDDALARDGVFPSTRYQGSKTKLLDWIEYCTKDLSFDSVLDAFGGTGSVGYMFKQQGKKIFYNDALKFNHYIGCALIENSEIVLDSQDIDFVLQKHSGIEYSTFIADTFHDIYFTDEENSWLDIIVKNIASLADANKRALAYYGLFQACIVKRPYNLFHRKNLYVRTAEVKRSFGNKKTWDTPFDEHFRKFVAEANAAVFDNGRKNVAMRSDVFDISVTADLVYIDPPYISSRGIGVNYFDFYHFLEGLVHYDKWAEMIDQKSRHKKIKNGKSEWCNKGEIHAAFERLFAKFADSILVVSYRSDGTPTIDELVAMLAKHKKHIAIQELDYKYALSNETSKEVLLIAD